MRTKLPKLTEQERKNVFKECVFSLDPVLSLNDKFINEVEAFSKRYFTPEKKYFRLTTDQFRTIEGRVNSIGTRVSLTLETKNFEEKAAWYKNKPEKNVTVIEKYAAFKAAILVAREKAEQLEIERKEREEKVNALRKLVPEYAPIAVEIDNWKNTTFSITINSRTQEEAELIIQKIKNII